MLRHKGKFTGFLQLFQLYWDVFPGRLCLHEHLHTLCSNQQLFKVGKSCAQM